MFWKFKKSTSKKQRASRLGLEALEPRAMLAGNVMARISGGSLQLFGDASANEVLIARTGPSQVQISALDETTRINGVVGPVTMNGFTNGIFASLGGGNDQIRLAGSADALFRTFGVVTISTGAGDDLVEFTNFNAWRSLVVNTGDGNDQVIASAALEGAATAGGFGLRVGTDAIFSLGAGNDRLTLTDSSVGRHLMLDAGAGADVLDIRRNQFSGLVLLNANAGVDSLNLAANTARINPIVINVEVRTAINGPTAVADSATVAEGASVNINVAANDTTAGAALDLDSIVIVNPPDNGTAQVNADGTVTYSSSGADVSSDFFTYTIADVSGNVSNAATVNITVTPVNDAPTIGPVGNVTTNVSTATGPIAVTLGDVDSPLASITLTGASSNQAVVQNGGIAISGSGANRIVVVTPVAGASGTSTITLTATDSGGATATETFDITVNAAPTISDVANVTIEEDTSTAELSVTLGDDLTPVGSLVLSATSNNQAVVQNSGITLGGSGSARTVVVTPVANATGDATITLTVTDASGATATDTFVVTVTPVNDGPTISAVADASVSSNATLGPLPVTVGDLETPAASLNVTATSSNQAVVQNGGVTIGGSGANRTVTVNPVVGASGTTTITLTVTDAGGLTATETFEVTVNAAPTIIDLPNLTIDEDTQAGPIEVTIGDAETPLASLQLTATSSNQAVVQNGGITLGGSEGARTVVITPVANASGDTTITLTVTDAAGATVTDTFVLTVTPVNDPPVATDEEFVINENLFLTIDVSGNLLSNDNDGGDGGALSISAISDGTVGTPVASVFGTFTINANGSFTFNLDEDAVDFLMAGDELFDQIGYTIFDGQDIDNAVLTIRIRGVNG